MKITIRRARQSDLDDMVVLWKEMMDFHRKSDRHFARSPKGHANWTKFAAGMIRSKKALVLVGRHRGELVGHLIACVDKYPPVFQDKVYGAIHDMVVRSEYRRHGVGTKLFREARQWFRKKGIKRIELGVAATDPISTSFWGKMGFKTFMERRCLQLKGS